MSNVFVIFSHGCVFNVGDYMKDNINGVTVHSMVSDGDECMTGLSGRDVNMLENISISGDLTEFKTRFSSGIESTKYREGVFNMHAMSKVHKTMIIGQKSGIYSLEYVIDNKDAFFDFQFYEDDPTTIPFKNYINNDESNLETLLENIYEGSLFPTKDNVLSLWNASKTKHGDAITYEQFESDFEDQYKFLIGDVLSLPFLKDSALIKFACATHCERPYTNYVKSGTRTGGKRSRRRLSKKRTNRMKRKTRRRM
jgi:hypothetical protein